MKQTMMIAAIGFCSFAYAGSVELPRTPKPKFIDMEADANVAVRAFAEADKCVTMTMECDTAKDNAMRVFVGIDKGKDGGLSLEETAFVAGWDAGEWVFEAYALGEDVKCKPCGENKRRKLTLTWTLDADGKVASLVAKEGDAVLSDALAAKLKSVFDKRWNCVRIVRNGVTEPNEKISLEAR